MTDESVQCPKCKQSVGVITPELRVINDEAVSMILGLHPVGFNCTNCGCYLLPGIIGAKQVQWGWAEAEPPLGIRLASPKIQLVQ